MIRHESNVDVKVVSCRGASKIRGASDTCVGISFSRAVEPLGTAKGAPIIDSLSCYIPGRSYTLPMFQAELCPEIHGESGLDGPHGGALLSRASRSALPHKAVPFMFERIAAEHAITWVPLTSECIACIGASLVHLGI